MTESIIFAGTPDNAASTLRFLVESGFDIELVLTRPDAVTGRKRELTASPVAKVAEEFGIECLKVNRLDSTVNERLQQSRSQLAIVVAFGVLLKRESIESLSKGWFNLHYSLLPELRGAAPVQHAILNGKHETGITLFRIDEGLDTGPILASLPAVIEPNDTTGALLSRLTNLGCSLLSQELPKLLNSHHVVVLSPQVGASSQAPKLGRNDGKLSFDRSAVEELNRIRATTPEPGAWCLLEGEALKIIEARAASGIALEPGEVSALQSRIFCGFANATVLELVSVQPAGKSAMNASDWHRGKKTKVWLN